MIRRSWGWLKFVPGDWWFMHFSRKPSARLLREARRRIKADTAMWRAQDSSELVRGAMEDNAESRAVREAEEW